MRTQCEIIGTLLQRKAGTTSMQMIVAANTTTPTRRLSDLRYKGWLITKKEFLSSSGNRYFRFYGKRPKETT